MTVVRKIVAPLGTPAAGTAAGSGARRRTSRVLAALLALLLLAAVIGVLQDSRIPAPAGADRAAARDSLSAAAAAALTRSFVTDVDEQARTATVDMSRSPEAVHAWMDETSAELDGWTIEVTGLDAPDGEERAALDAAAAEAEGDRPVEPPACPDLPVGARTDDGSTVPYLGCDPATGHEPPAAPVRGGVRHSLGAAVDMVLAELIPGADLAASRASVSGGQAVVDLPADFPGAAANAPVPAHEIDRALLFTAYSNGALDSVRFRVAGDCLAYATAVDGDMCATVPLPVELPAEPGGASGGEEE
ncbi:hypothetical protein [Myceligenerans pegani]|uniref:Uncharacterized protein n=1 Tax=Myceligenerans pegani TaxID=2776917 RepID=A0ABR9MU59_9MICO|nr:hypothetical protein [Myceligenerans sp. TRM 65318]MBE1874601.1 hypothetical protein [Myceligenerans sp. TRM 65318]MBE3016872.1 hypothetical protein [Myceligenerans sp. TRM 65318]